MSGAASFGSGIAPGSGRSLDLRWPAKLGTVVQAAFPVGAASYGRQQAGATTIDNNSSSTPFGGTSGTNYFVNYKGRGGGLQIFANPVAAGNGMQFNLGPHCLWPAVGDAAVDEGDPVDEALCWRSYAILSFAGGSLVQDNGIQWVTDPGGHGTILIAGNNGFGFQQIAAGQVAFIRNNAGVTASTIVLDSTAADLARWHSYEIRIIGASSKSRAKLIALVDGIPKFTAFWITDPSLPNPPVVVTSYGLTACVVSRSGAGMFCHHVRTMAGPTEASLL